MESSECENITQESCSNTIDPDYSLNDLFDTDWNKANENTGENNPDPNFSLDDCFEVDWTYVPKKDKKMSISPKSVIEIMRYETKADFRRLLNSGYKLEVLNDKGQTALHLLFHWKNWEYLALLDTKFSSYPMDVYNTNCIDSEGLTHLHVACAKGSLSMVTRYLQNNDNINSCYKGTRSDVYSGFTALHFAVMNPKSEKNEIVKKLIQCGANVNAVDANGRTPLHIAPRIFKMAKRVKYSGKDSIEVMDILLENKCDIDATDVDGNTPLLSVFTNYYEFLIDDCDTYDDDSFHVSKYMREVKEKFKFFLKHGADVIATNNENKNILHLVLENLMIYRCQLLDANYIFDDSDHLDMVKQIFNVNSEIDVNLKSAKGETPLHMAVASMSTRMVELLLHRGADLKDLTFESKGQRGSFFCYPDRVAIFEQIQDLINVLDLLSSRGFNLSLQDNIAILQFLMHKHRDCECGDYPYKNVKLVLHYGSKNHMEDILTSFYSNSYLYESSGYEDVYSDRRLAGTKDLYSDLLEYLETTRLGNIYSDEGVKQKINDINEDILSSRFNPNWKYRNYIIKDLKRLQSTMFDNKVSLHDVLQKDPLDTPHWIVNNFDLKMIESLHCYKDAVKGHITRARVRCLFEKYSSDYLKLICDNLPDVCCRMIVYYLSNEDILNLCLATTK